MSLELHGSSLVFIRSLVSCRFSEKYLRQTVFLAEIIRDMNAVSAKLLFKNTCLYVNVYLQAGDSGLSLALHRYITFKCSGLRSQIEKSRIKLQRYQKIKVLKEYRSAGERNYKSMPSQVTLSHLSQTSSNG